MPRLVTRNATGLILTVIVRDAAGDPVESIAHNDLSLLVDYRASADTDWTAIALVAGVAGTWSNGGWVHIGDGRYQLGLPDAAIVSGDRTTLRIEYDGVVNDDSIDAVISPSTSISMSAEAAAAIEAGEDLEVMQGDDYVDRPQIIDVESEVDLTGKHLVIAAKPQSGTGNAFAVRMPIEGSAPNHFVTFDPTSAITEAWTAGDYDLRYRIQHAANKYQTIGTGTLTVRPFDTPEPPTDI